MRDKYICCSKLMRAIFSPSERCRGGPHTSSPSPSPPSLLEPDSNAVGVVAHDRADGVEHPRLSVSISSRFPIVVSPDAMLQPHTIRHTEATDHINETKKTQYRPSRCHPLPIKKSIIDRVTTHPALMIDHSVEGRPNQWFFSRRLTAQSRRGSSPIQDQAREQGRISLFQAKIFIDKLRSLVEPLGRSSPIPLLLLLPFCGRICSTETSTGVHEAHQCATSISVAPN